MRVLALFAGGVLYWLLVRHMAGVREPWDAGTFWTLWYPLSIGLAAVAGPFLPSRAWLAGAAITFAQLPSIGSGGAIGTLWIAGVLILALLSIPAMAAASLSHRLRTRRA